MRSLGLTVLHCLLSLLRRAAGFSSSSLLQWSVSDQSLRFISSQSVPSAGTVSPAHGHHQQPHALSRLRRDRAVLLTLPGREREHGISTGIPAVSALLPDPVPGPADVEQPSAAGLRCSTGPQQQNHKHREPASEGQAARCITRLGHASKLTTDSRKSMHFCVDVLCSGSTSH